MRKPKKKTGFGLINLIVVHDLFFPLAWCEGSKDDAFLCFENANGIAISISFFMEGVAIFGVAINERKVFDRLFQGAENLFQYCRSKFIHLFFACYYFRFNLWSRFGFGSGWGIRSWPHASHLLAINIIIFNEAQKNAKYHLFIQSAKRSMDCKILSTCVEFSCTCQLYDSPTQHSL